MIGSISKALFRSSSLAIPRTAGWLAQWQEMLHDPDHRIARPRQVYTGSDRSDYTGLDAR